MKKKIVFIGAGNLATQLSKALSVAEYDITQVYSRTQESANILADKLSCEAICNLDHLDLNADYYFFALSDKALLPILKQMPKCDAVFLHTAGSLPMRIFQEFSFSYGVFYPIQTFSKARDVDFSTIPICVEACNEYLLTILKDMGARISNNVESVNSEQRKKLHLAAVFTCNFTNHMYAIGEELLNESNLSFELLKPLILETANKAQTMSPIEAQTGPAVRFDEGVINSHEESLKNTPILQKLYRFVSESIFRFHQGKKK